MQVTEAALEEFIGLYKEMYGQDLSRDEASEMSLRLLTLFGLLSAPLPEEQLYTSTPKPEIR